MLSLLNFLKGEKKTKTKTLFPLDFELPAWATLSQINQLLSPPFLFQLLCEGYQALPKSSFNKYSLSNEQNRKMP